MNSMEDFSIKGYPRDTLANVWRVHCRMSLGSPIWMEQRMFEDMILPPRKTKSGHRVPLAI